MDDAFPRTLQVLPALESGGVEKATLDWVRILCNRFPNAPVFVASAGGKLVKDLENLGAHHFTLPLNTKNPWKLWRNAQALQRLTQDYSIQLIHVRSRAPAWSALWAAQRLKVPLLTTYHGVYNSRNRVKRFYNSVMARGDKVIAISQSIAQYIQQQHGSLSSSVTVIPEGIDTDIFDPEKVTVQQINDLCQAWGVPSNRFLILLPGRLTRWKGQEVLIKALRLLTDLPICAVFLGSDQGRKVYIDHLRQVSQDLDVRFIEECDRMPVAYAAADVVLSCSIEAEAFGRVTAEALAMARPYIGTNLGATPELCLDKQTGFLVPPDDENALAQKVQDVFHLTSEYKQKMGFAARQHIVENFSLEKMAEATLKVYQSLCAKFYS
jgi:glycosyltransferase involved in cell wall biosynthesis